jgi:3-hydroxyisobutyrate dehydrogenase-like beta-hydroxyacid dehydrogenase
MSQVSDNIRIGWIGLGPQGYNMIHNLAKSVAGHPSVTLPVLVWNRSSEKADRLLASLGDAHIAIADGPEDIVTKCDVIFTSLASDEVVKNIYERFAAAIKVRFPTY